MVNLHIYYFTIYKIEYTVYNKLQYLLLPSEDLKVNYYKDFEG